MPILDPIAGACTWEISWANPYTQPPNGGPRIRLSVTRLQSSTWPNPPVIDKAYSIIGLGTGWCVRVIPHMPEPRKLSPEAKGKIRRRNMEKRIQAKAPLFANDLIQIELESRPGYFAGEDYSHQPKAAPAAAFELI